MSRRSSPGRRGNGDHVDRDTGSSIRSKYTSLKSRGVEVFSAIPLAVVGSVVSMIAPVAVAQESSQRERIDRRRAEIFREFCLMLRDACCSMSLGGDEHRIGVWLCSACRKFLPGAMPQLGGPALGQFLGSGLVAGAMKQQTAAACQQTFYIFSQKLSATRPAGPEAGQDAGVTFPPRRTVTTTPRSRPRSRHRGARQTMGRQADCRPDPARRRFR